MNTNIILFENMNQIQIRIYSVCKFKLNTNTNIFSLKISTEDEYEYYSVFEKHRLIWYLNIFGLNYLNIFKYRIIRSPLSPVWLARRKKTLYWASILCSSFKVQMSVFEAKAVFDMDPLDLLQCRKSIWYYCNLSAQL